MTIGWILIGVLVLGLFGLVTYALVKVASDADRAARRARPGVCLYGRSDHHPVGSGELVNRGRSVPTVRRQHFQFVDGLYSAHEVPR